MARYSHKRHDTIRYDITQNIAIRYDTIRYDTIRSRRDDGRRRRFGDRRLAFNLRSQATRRSSSLAPSTVVTSDSGSVCFPACAATCAVCLVHSSGRVRPNNALTSNQQRKNRVLSVTNYSYIVAAPPIFTAPTCSFEVGHGPTADESSSPARHSAGVS